MPTAFDLTDYEKVGLARGAEENVVKFLSTRVMFHGVHTSAERVEVFKNGDDIIFVFGDTGRKLKKEAQKFSTYSAGGRMIVGLAPKGSYPYTEGEVEIGGVMKQALKICVGEGKTKRRGRPPRVGEEREQEADPVLPDDKKDDPQPSSHPAHGMTPKQLVSDFIDSFGGETFSIGRVCEFLASMGRKDISPAQIKAIIASSDFSVTATSQRGVYRIIKQAS